MSKEDIKNLNESFVVDVRKSISGSRCFTTQGSSLQFPTGKNINPFSSNSSVDTSPKNSSSTNDSKNSK